MEKLRNILPDQQIYQTQTKSTRRNEKLKQANTLNNNILIAKTLEDFTPKANIDPFKYTYFKNMFKTIFFPKIGAVLYLQI